MIHYKLDQACTEISDLFDNMDGVQASNWQKELVADFMKQQPQLIDDLDFCFAVLAGQYKLGFSLYPIQVFLGPDDSEVYSKLVSIEDVYHQMVKDTRVDKTDDQIYRVIKSLPQEQIEFFIKLFNREYRLGYSNRQRMVTNMHCMLAKSYPKVLPSAPKYYILQEKLNGNRCIAWFDFIKGIWRYTSRSQKEKTYPFDMSKLDVRRVYDGEVMRRNAMNNQDFSTTSGLANSKYGDKSQLVYIIYDILNDNLSYREREKLLYSLLPDKKYALLDRQECYSRFKFEDTQLSKNVAILPRLGVVTVYPNVTYNHLLDKYLDEITAQGGEGIMLRDPNAVYYHSSGSGDRPNSLLKYKKLKTCDLRIVGWNEGKGKYYGMIGSFICEDDNKTIKVNVAGIDDDIRASDPTLWLNKIIEVAYFDTSKSKTKTIKSLQFPRYKQVRNDKTETSLF
jgi:hypothetical protein